MDEEEYVIDRLRDIDNNLKDINGRLKLTKKLINENAGMIEKHINESMLNVKSRMEQQPINRAIESLGTYLIRSSDIDSTRKVDYSFYEDERKYRQYAIGKATLSTDIEEGIAYGSLGDGCKTHDVYDLDDEVEDSMTIDLTVLDTNQLKRLVRVGIKEKDHTQSRLKSFMGNLYNFTLGGLKKESDIEIFELMIKGFDDNEISEIVKKPRRTVNYRVNNIVKTIGGFNNC